MSSSRRFAKYGTLFGVLYFTRGLISTLVGFSRRFAKYGTLFGVLYFAQGLISTLVGFSLLRHLRLSADNNGLFLAVLSAPWVAKPLWGLIVDKWGKKRSWMWCNMVVMAVTIGLIPVCENFFRPLLAIALIGSLARSFQDVATDAFAIQILLPRDRSWIQSVMWTSTRLGELAGGAGVMYLSAHKFSWTATCLLVAAIVLLAAVLARWLWRKHENRKEQDAADTTSAPDHDKPSWREILGSFRGIAPIAGMIVALLGCCAVSMTDPAVPGWWQGQSDKFVAKVLFWNSVVKAASALFSGFALSKLERRRAFALIVLWLGGAFALIGATLPHDETAIFWVVMIAAVAEGAFKPQVCALFMEITNPRVAATQFAVYMGVLNLGNTWASLAGGHLTKTIGTAGVFLFGGFLQLAVLIPLAFTRPRKRKDA